MQFLAPENDSQTNRFVEIKTQAGESSIKHLRENQIETFTHAYIHTHADTHTHTHEYTHTHTHTHARTFENSPWDLLINNLYN